MGKHGSKKRKKKPKLEDLVFPFGGDFTNPDFIKEIVEASRKAMRELNGKTRRQEEEKGNTTS